MTDLATLAAQLSPKARELLARELVRAGTAMPMAAEPVAVIGMACRLPGNIVGPESFWEFLIGGGDAIREVPPDRWDLDAFYDPDRAAPGRMTTRWGGFLSDVAGFDADFFGIAPREAEAMDPQQRILLEVAWEALEHAGIPCESLSGTRTAVMAGLSTWDYMLVSVDRRAEIDAYLTTGIPHSSAVGRISYLLGLRGPSVAIDTACSSSLVAVHLACQSLRLQESDLALAGGVQLNLSPYIGIALSKYSALSPAGRCKAFDATADGFVQSEGCGLVVLKRLSDALRDGDRVLSVVRGTAINQDGRSNGMTAPNAMAQRDVITEALREADVAADTVSYVEAHGTGTPLGDPIEFEALGATYGRGDGKCVLGAVKSNLGHLEAAGGVAGVIKATLALGRGQIPPNLHFQRWNPAIDASSTRFFVPTETTDWPECAGPRRAAVSSFGFSGTNAHLVLEQAPVVDDERRRDLDPPVSTLVVSGKTGSRVASMAGVLADWVGGAGVDVPLADVAYTLSHHRTRHGKTAAVCARDRVEAIAGLRALAADQPAVQVVGPQEGCGGPGTVFVYSGQGSQWPGMGQQLLADEPAFAKAIAELEPEFLVQTGFSLEATLASGHELVGTDRIQPVLVGIQLALTELWRAYGIEPDAVIGHSMGEVSAAVVAGALSVADGLRVIATRSRLMAQLAPRGAMALLELDAAATQALIEDHPEVTLAVYASPRQNVIAGPREIIESLISIVQQQNRLAQLVGVEVASHHPSMDPVLPELRAALAGLSPTAPAIPLIATAREDPCATPILDVDYWAANLRNPVHFTQAVTAAAANRAMFVEISPHPLVTHAITDILGSTAPVGSHKVVSTVNRHQPETLFFHTQLAAVAPGSTTAAGRLVDLPPTPWHHTTHWFPDRSAGIQVGTGHPLLGVHVEIPPDGDHAWHADVGTEAVPWLADYQVHGQPVMPAAAFVEIVLAAGSEALDVPVSNLQLKKLDIEQVLPLDSATQITTRLVRAADGGIRVEIYSRSGSWVRQAVAIVEVAPPPTAPAPAAGPTEPPDDVISKADFYAGLGRHSEHRGPAFTALTRVVRLRGNASETDIEVPDEAPQHAGYCIHPVVLDAALQSLHAAIGDESLKDADEVAYLPVSFDGLRVFGGVGLRARCHADLVGYNGDDPCPVGRIRLTDVDGNPTVEISSVRLLPVERRTFPLALARKVFDATWVEKSIPEPNAMATPAPGSWLVLADSSDMAAVAERFAIQLRTPQRRVLTANLADESAVLEAFAETAADAALPPVGVVVFVPQRPIGATDLEAAASHAEQSIWTVSKVVRTIARGWHGRRSPRLWLVTDRGLVVSDGESGDPAIGALKGLVRVLAYEHPELRATLVDLDPDEEPLAALTAELSCSDGDDVTAWRGPRRHVERLSRVSLDRPRLDPVVRQGGSYIVTGGLGGVGMVVVRWLVDSGAGRVVLNGRREPSPEHRKALVEMEKSCEIVVIPGDISAPGVAAELVASADGSAQPLRGVVHAAAVIDDALVLEMSRESLERVWAGKAIGAVRLHHATATRKLDWWVAFSSASSLLGSPGQAAYASANAWLHALAAWRRASRLPATVIDWGPWSDVGVARSLTSSVLDPISPTEGIEALAALLAGDRVRTGVLRLRPDRVLAAFPEIRRLGYFAGVVAELEEHSGDDWPGPDRLRDLDPAEARRIISNRIVRPIAAVMGFADESAIDPKLPLVDLGMDSLLAVRIRNTISADFGVEPSVALLLQGASLPDLIGDVIRQLGLADQEHAPGWAESVRDRAQQRAAARQGAALRRKRG
jgi:phthiocerol/phenolphthiocerol synthesis type-I polyketide synthase D